VTGWPGWPGCRPALVQDTPSSQHARDYDGSETNPAATVAVKVAATVAAARPPAACCTLPAR
jgi:hypothetical protein